jgi:hypothetical protein
MARSSKALPTEAGMLVVRSRFTIQRSLQVGKYRCRLRRTTTELADPHSQTTCTALWQGGLPVAATLVQGYVFRTAPGGIKGMKVMEDVLR